MSASRKQINALLTAYKSFKAPAKFEKAFLTHAILAMDHYFMHRMRGAEGKDGNPLNEVRMLCNSIKHHDGVMTADSTIKYDADKAIVGAALGKPIRLSLDSVTKLAGAFFDEIKGRYK